MILFFILFTQAFGEKYSRGFCFETSTLDRSKKILLCEDINQRCYVRTLGSGNYSFTCREIKRNHEVKND